MFLIWHGETYMKNIIKNSPPPEFFSKSREILSSGMANSWNNAMKIASSEYTPINTMSDFEKRLVYAKPKKEPYYKAIIKKLKDEIETLKKGRKPRAIKKPSESKEYLFLKAFYDTVIYLKLIETDMESVVIRQYKDRYIVYGACRKSILITPIEWAPIIGLFSFQHSYGNLKKPSLGSKYSIESNTIGGHTHTVITLLNRQYFLENSIERTIRPYREENIKKILKFLDNKEYIYLEKDMLEILNRLRKKYAKRESEGDDGRWIKKDKKTFNVLLFSCDSGLFLLVEIMEGEGEAKLSEEDTEKISSAPCKKNCITLNENLIARGGTIKAVALGEIEMTDCVKILYDDHKENIIAGIDRDIKEKISEIERIIRKN